jgi:hypothetical protein
VEAKHLLHKLQNNWLVKHVPLQPLQSTWGDKEVRLLRLLLKEEKSSVAGVNFSCIQAFKTVEVASENLLFISEGTSS